MSRSSIVLAVIATMVGCGGKVVFVEDGGEGGAGNGPQGGNGTGAAANGGAPSTSSSSTTDAGQTVSTNSSVATVGVGGSGGHGALCVFNQPSPECDACADDAISGPCSPAVDACAESDECVAYANCILDQCDGEPDCCAKCEFKLTDGAKEYSDLIFCVTCELCPAACASAVPGFCN